MDNDKNKDLVAGQQELENRKKESSTLTKTGLAAGTALTTMGIGTAGGAKFIENELNPASKHKFFKPEQLSKFKKVVSNKAASRGMAPEELVKDAKSKGIIAASVGVPLLGFSVYKHYKNRKARKDVNLEK